MVISAMAFYGYHQFTHTPKATVRKFEQAVRKNQPQKVARLLTTAEHKMKITAQTVKPLIRYYKHHPAELAAISQDLQSAIDRHEKPATAKVFTLKKAAHSSFFWKNYQLEVALQTFKIKFDDEAKNVTIKNHGELLPIDKDGVVGPLIPGEYQLTVSYDDQFYYFNKEDKKITLVNSDQKMAISVEKALKKNKNFHKNLLQDIMDYYTSEGSVMKNNFNANYLQNATAEYTNFYQEYCELIKETILSYDREFSGITLNLDTLALKKEDDNWQITIDAFVDQKEALKYKNDNGQEEKKEFNDMQSAILTLYYEKEQHKWQIDDINYQTYKRNPKEWQNQLKKSLPQTQKIHWEPSTNNHVV